jgi:hypothetical protein
MRIEINKETADKLKEISGEKTVSKSILWIKNNLDTFLHMHNQNKALKKRIQIIELKIEQIKKLIE